MNETALGLLDKALTLSIADRQLIADGLYASMSLEDFEDPTEDPEFMAEIERRMQQMDEHPELTIDGEQFLKEMRERYTAKVVS